MTEEKNRSGDTQYSLDELNQQFVSNIKKKKKKKRKKYKGTFGIGMLVLLAAVVLIVAGAVWKVTTGTRSAGKSTEDTAAAKTVIDEEETEMFNESVLNEEEQEKWAETDLDEENIYVELNSKIYLDGSKAYIRLINPIYSAYYYTITIYPEGEEDTLLYQSEKIAPGTILEAVALTAEPTEEQYSAIIKYDVYDAVGNELGSHPVSVEFTTDEQYK